MVGYNTQTNLLTEIGFFRIGNWHRQFQTLSTSTILYFGSDRFPHVRHFPELCIYSGMLNLVVGGHVPPSLTSQAKTDKLHRNKSTIQYYFDNIV